MKNNEVIIKSGKDIEYMKEACREAADILVYIQEFIKPGISTNEINDICHVHYYFYSLKSTDCIAFANFYFLI